jgi:hypothetical protein
MVVIIMDHTKLIYVSFNTTGTPGAIQPVLYDPLTPVNVEKMNMAYMHRQMPVFTGAYVRMPVAAMPMQQHQHM